MFKLHEVARLVIVPGKDNARICQMFGDALRHIHSRKEAKKKK